MLDPTSPKDARIDERLRTEPIIWLATTRPDGRPHVAPTWAIWHENVLYFDGSPETRRMRNLAQNPAISVHLESGDEVVIVEGVWDQAAELGPALRARLQAASVAKYGAGGGDEAVFVVRPRTVLAWHRLPEDATRWRFPPAEG